MQSLIYLNTPEADNTAKWTIFMYIVQLRIQKVHLMVKELNISAEN